MSHRVNKSLNVTEDLLFFSALCVQFGLIQRRFFMLCRVNVSTVAVVVVLVLVVVFVVVVVVVGTCLFHSDAQNVVAGVHTTRTCA